ncbi:MAG: heavy-metal-associated domain-containing protein [Rhodocyclales bacterium]|nr:heavy-metal-associated domain-containing protein [Rhodocyclales bacterium]MBI5784302.1 heavy-metal-associated domain-containing protein [Rhodocyclales bacterium]
MTRNHANVMVDLRQVPTGNGRSELECELGGLAGVSQARISARAGRLVLVDYDPKAISSRQILGAVVRRGYDARLVGM